jgi:predicted ATPase
LVGRDGELAELTALLSSPEVRLVTLTGPGGSGKTRLAICLAQRLIERFPDGVYFAPLAAATNSEVMWTSIGEQLELPPKGRMPPGLFAHVAHRSALLVLDNLEQIAGADAVVAELLAAAPRLVVIATSRRPLTVAAEHLHPVPPLELPEDNDPEAIAASGAVQLFVDRARKTKPDFSLTADNAADIGEVCRRLDGLPLALELAAARIRLLSPAALLARLDTALELKDTAVDRPTRQRTLRDTITWSYDLLSPAQQAFFRALGVFAGGGDLDAISAVTAERLNGEDALEMVADLVDASLATITEDERGEPRVGMLEVIRTYANEQLTAAGEANTARWNHAHHYSRLAAQLEAMQENDFPQARSLADIELDNFRAALTWLLEGSLATHASHIGLVEQVGVQLCANLCWLWRNGGYLAEGRRWCESAIARAGDRPSVELATCLHWLADILALQGQAKRACTVAAQGLAIARTLAAHEVIMGGLGALSFAQTLVGDFDGAERHLDEALSLARMTGHRHREAMTLGDLAVLAGRQRDYLAAERLARKALAISKEIGDTWGTAVHCANIANTYVLSDRVEDAHAQMRASLELALSLRDPHFTATFAETYVHVLAKEEDPVSAARLLGAVNAMRERDGVPSTEHDEELTAALAAAQTLIPAEEWERHYQQGHGEPVELVLRELMAACDPNPTAG